MRSSFVQLMGDGPSGTPGPSATATASKSAATAATIRRPETMAWTAWVRSRRRAIARAGNVFTFSTDIPCQVKYCCLIVRLHHYHHNDYWLLTVCEEGTMQTYRCNSNRAKQIAALKINYFKECCHWLIESPNVWRYASYLKAIVSLILSPSHC